MTYFKHDSACVDEGAQIGGGTKIWHFCHVQSGARIGINCVLGQNVNAWNLDALEEIERESGCRVFTVLQLRVHPALVALKERLASRGGGHNVTLTYVTSRGPWYQVSWKGSEERSGGLPANIGIHLFDLVMWLFGPARRSEVHLRTPLRMAGFLELERAEVRWFLSLDAQDLPFRPAPGGKVTYRSITVDGEEVEFTEGFADLHTSVYERTLSGHGFGIDDARPSVELVHRIRTEPITGTGAGSHPALLANLIGKIR